MHDDLLRRFLTGEIGPGSRAEIMIGVWRQADPAQQELWIASLMNWSMSKRWAWDALKRLLRDLRQKREPLPRLLSEWAQAVAAGDRRTPGQGRGRPSDEDRDFRIWIVVRVLVHEQGKSQAAAHKEVSAALPHENLSPGGIKSICQRMRVARPFPVQK